MTLLAPATAYAVAPDAAASQQARAAEPHTRLGSQDVNICH